jgi:hypothetical protein
VCRLPRASQLTPGPGGGASAAEPRYGGVSISDVLAQELGVGGVLSLLWFRRQLPVAGTKFLEMILLGGRGPRPGGERRTQHHRHGARWGVVMIEKRGGNLCAPAPRPLGYSGYLNDLSEEQLDNNLQEYKDICLSYPREGRGVEEHCVDTGLDDPQSKKMAKAQYDMVAVAEAVQMLDGVDTMVAKYSSQPSDALRNISVQTAKTKPPSGLKLRARVRPPGSWRPR